MFTLPKTKTYRPGREIYGRLVWGSRTAHIIGNIKSRSSFNLYRKWLTDDFGLKIPQDIYDALTRKHLELKGRGE